MNPVTLLPAGLVRTGLLLTVLLLVPGTVAGPTSASAQAAEARFERSTAGSTALDAKVQFSAGRIDVRPARRAGVLYAATLRYDDEVFSPLHRFEEGRLVVGVEGSGTTRIRQADGNSQLELRLSREVPTALHLEVGAVQSTLDLGGISLSGLHLSTGAADTRVTVSERNPVEMDEVRIEVGAAAFRGTGLGRLGAARYEVDVGVGDVRLELAGLERTETRIEARVGLGALDIRVPDDIGVRLTRSSLLAGLNAPDLTRRGDAWLSANWDDAPRKVNIHVSAAFGSVTVRTESFGPDQP